MARLLVGVVEPVNGGGKGNKEDDDDSVLVMVDDPGCSYKEIKYITIRRICKRNDQGIPFHLLKKDDYGLYVETLK